MKAICGVVSALFLLIYFTSVHAAPFFKLEQGNNSTVLTIGSEQFSSNGVDGVRLNGVQWNEDLSDDDSKKRPPKSLFPATSGEIAEEGLFQLPVDGFANYEPPFESSEALERRSAIRQLIEAIIQQRVITEALHSLDSLAARVMPSGLFSYGQKIFAPQRESEYYSSEQLAPQIPDYVSSQIISYGSDSSGNTQESRSTTAQNSHGVIRRIFCCFSRCFGGGQAGAGGDEPDENHSGKKIKAACEAQPLLSVTTDENDEVGAPPEPAEIEVEVFQVNVDGPGIETDQPVPVEIIAHVYRTDNAPDESGNEVVRVETERRSYNVEINIPSRLLCGICSYLMASPTFSCESQSHVYCRRCLEQSETSQCPECRQSYPQGLTTCGMFLKDIHQLEISCPQCQADMQLSDIEDHLNRHCSWQPVPCPVCYTEVAPVNIRQHAQDCFGKESDLDIHSQSEEGQLFVTFISALLNHLPEAHQSAEELPANRCPDCDGEFASDFYKKHLSRCPQAKITCEHCGEKVIRQVHTEKHGDQCPHRTVRCSISGCSQSWVQGEPQTIAHHIELDGIAYHNEDGEGVRYTRDDGFQSVVIFAHRNKIAEHLKVVYAIPQWNLLVGFSVGKNVCEIVLGYRNSDIEADITKGKNICLEKFSASGDILDELIIKSTLLDYQLKDDREKRKGAIFSCNMYSGSDLRGQSLYLQLTLTDKPACRTLDFCWYNNISNMPILPEYDRNKE